ncbi:MAG: hypothetical protein IPP72_08300 [Chitinophagaceae bacterium]|nr:hypothetical protein [Chitinophagaceae bacterium]
MNCGFSAVNESYGKSFDLGFNEAFPIERSLMNFGNYGKPELRLQFLFNILLGLVPLPQELSLVVKSMLDI